MSTGLECNLINVKSLGWFYILQSPGCPVSAWDWRDHEPDADGPFDSEDAAFAALRGRHANPGGYAVDEVHLLKVLADPVLKGIVEDVMKAPLRAPEPPAEGIEMAGDLVSLNGQLNIDIGWFRQTCLPDNTVDIVIKDRLDGLETNRVRVSISWMPDALRAEIRSASSMPEALVGFISRHIVHAAGHYLPNLTCVVQEVTPD